MMNSAENPPPLTNEQRWKQEKSDAKVGDCKGHDEAVRCFTESSSCCDEPDDERVF